MTTRILILLILLTFITPVLAQEPPELLENVPIKSSGIELFSEPDRGSERLFAIMGDFAPHLVGQYTDENDTLWVYVYFIEGGQWIGAWARASSFDLTELGDDPFADLPDIDPENLPEIPDLDFSFPAIRPSGYSSPVSSDNSGSVVYEVYDCTYTGGDSFQWNKVEVTYEDGVATAVSILEEGITGDWQPGCPGKPGETVTGGSSGNESGGNGGDDGCVEVLPGWCDPQPGGGDDVCQPYPPVCDCGANNNPECG